MGRKLSHKLTNDEEEGTREEVRSEGRDFGELMESPELLKNQGGMGETHSWREHSGVG